MCYGDPADGPFVGAEIAVDVGKLLRDRLLLNVFQARMVVRRSSSVSGKG
jgi:hypothetical protein